MRPTSSAAPNPSQPAPPPVSRLMTSVRRTLSTSKRRDPVPPHSATERMPQHFRSASTAPPTVEQIAMGLHLSRTPTFARRDGHAHGHGQTRYPPPPASHPQPSLKAPKPNPHNPPLQLRSSLKKPASSAFASVPTPALSTSSTTDVTSTTPQSSERSSASLRARMGLGRFMRGSGAAAQPNANKSSSTPSSALSSPRTSTSEVNHLPRKKAVRFSHPVQEED